MPALSLTLLGPFQLCRAGRPLGGFDSAKVRALLAFLAVESGRAHSRAALAELLWPAQGEGAARHSLSQALSNLRRVLGDREADTPVLALGREAVGFDPAACAVDALALGAALSGCAAHLPHAAAGCAACAHGLEAALAGYGGGFLDGLALDDSPAFEEWAARTREGYVRMALQGLQTLGEHALARGEYERARGAARRQLELDPLHEAGHRQLMEAHARSVPGRGP
jgi:DNA-binding SARP family transcriptional activator